MDQQRLSDGGTNTGWVKLQDGEISDLGFSGIFGIVILILIFVIFIYFVILWVL
jgi:hypothetical protein